MNKESLEKTIEIPKLKEQILIESYKEKIQDLDHTIILELPKLKKLSFTVENDETQVIEMPMLKSQVSNAMEIPNLENTILIELPRLKKNKNKIFIQLEKNFLRALSVITAVFIIFLSYEIGVDLVNYKNTNKNIDNIYDIADVVNVVASSEEYEKVMSTQVDESSDYYKYREYSYIDVNFDKLKEINNETVGWLQVPNTKVNYPFVKANDNDYYLSHSFDKSYNGGGWVFMDYRNDINNLSQNTIIYAHGLYNGTMFGSLKSVFQQSWYNQKDFIIKISTENQNSNWEIFSIYKIPTTTDYLTTNFESDEDYRDFLNMIKSRSEYHFDTDVDENSKILTLSTCYTHEIKMVIHAKLLSTN